jgi:hypothetical protein
MTRVVEPMIDLHQPLHDTKMIEMLRCHLDVPLGKRSNGHESRNNQNHQGVRLFSAVRKKVVRMKAIHSSRPRIVSGRRRAVGLERRHPSELYPLGI